MPRPRTPRSTRARRLIAVAPAFWFSASLHPPSSGLNEAEDTAAPLVSAVVSPSLPRHAIPLQRLCPDQIGGCYALGNGGLDQASPTPQSLSSTDTGMP